MTASQSSGVGIASHKPHGLKAAWQYLCHLATADNDRARSGRNALTAFTVRLGSAALLYATQVLIARWTGSHDYGIYVYAWTLVMLFGAIAHFGFNTTMIRLIPEYRETGDIAASRGLIAGGRGLTFTSGALMAVAAIAIILAAGDRIPAHYVYPLIFGFLCIPAYAITDLHDGLGRANAWMGTALIPPYLLRPLLLLAAVFTAIVLGAAPGATTVAAAAIAATVLTMAIQYIFIERRLARTTQPGPRRYDFRQWFRISIPLVVIGVSDMLLHHTDIIVISLYLTPSDAGIYYAAAKTMALMLYVHYAVGSAVANRLSALNAAGDHEGLVRCVRDAVNWTFWPSVLAGAAILALGKPLLWMFGPQFESGYPVMLILVAGFLVRAAFGPTEFMLNMLGAHRQCAIVLVTAAIINIALNLALVPLYGTLGAAAATTVTLAGVSITNYVIALKSLDLNFAIWAPRHTQAAK